MTSSSISPFAEDPVSNRKAANQLLCVCCVSSTFMLVEIVGGYMSNSIAIMSDAAHLFSDILGFLVGVLAIKLSGFGECGRYNFGYRRAESIGAMISVVIIWILTVCLLYSAVGRVISPPEQFNPDYMVVTSFIGVICNIIMGYILYQEG